MKLESNLNVWYSQYFMFCFIQGWNQSLEIRYHTKDVEPVLQWPVEKAKESRSEDFFKTGMGLILYIFYLMQEHVCTDNYLR